MARTENSKLTPDKSPEIALKRQDIHYPKPRVVTLTLREVGSYTRKKSRHQHHLQGIGAEPAWTARAFPTPALSSAAPGRL